jgi:hypothetical protein
MRGERSVERLDRLEPEGLDSVEQPLAGPEQDGDDVEREFVDHSGGERLPDGRGAARDVDAILAGRLTRLRVGGGFSRLWSGPATKPSSEIDM